MNNKTHYRKVFKSDHLGCADLEEFIEEKKDLIFTIKEVKQQYNTAVAGRKIDANIAYFKEPIKPMVLNSTNSKTMASITGSKFVEDWCNVEVELFIDPSAKLKGEVVGGLRIKRAILKWDELESLFDVKKESIESERVKNCQRIIDNKEVNSYNKLFKYLKSL